MMIIDDALHQDTQNAQAYILNRFNPPARFVLNWVFERICETDLKNMAIRPAEF